MTLEFYPNPRRKKRIVIEALDNINVQWDWIVGIEEQVAWANNPEVLPDYILELKIAKRRIEP